MLVCPNCKLEICIRKIAHPGLFKNYRIYPNCGEKLTPVRDARYLQAFAITIALSSTTMTILLYFGDNDWLFLAIVSYVNLGFIIYWCNKRIYLVPCKEQRQ